jgi:hypothetical protein
MVDMLEYKIYLNTNVVLRSLIWEEERFLR